jgi:hypothetical protein
MLLRRFGCGGREVGGGGRLTRFWMIAGTYMIVDSSLLWHAQQFKKRKLEFLNM